MEVKHAILLGAPRPLHEGHQWHPATVPEGRLCAASVAGLVDGGGQVIIVRHRRRSLE